jgi:lysozyme
MSESNLNKAVEVAAALCRHFEGFVSKPYLCPAGYWTQGYGTVNKPNKTTVKPGDPPITKEIAEIWLTTEIRNVYLPGVLKRSPHLINYPYILGALTDFAYNLGVPRYSSSTLSRRVNERDWESAIVELKRWTRGGGKVLPGLVRRREAEAQYFK